MQRSPKFEANILRPIAQAALYGSDLETIKGIADEVIMFACPWCGHGTMDHSWTGTPTAEGYFCLIGDPRFADRGQERCECKFDITTWADKYPEYEENELRRVISDILGYVPEPA